MGILHFSPTFSNSFSRASALSIVLAPAQAVLALVLPARQVAAGTSAPVYQQNRYRTAIRSGDVAQAPWRAGAARTTLPRAAVSNFKAPGRLKVLREFEPGVGPALAGRMVISGRMADVCAELDRMTQRDPSGI